LSLIVAPYEPLSSDYAVEAEMQATSFVPSQSTGFVARGSFGLVVRGDNRAEYHGGIFDNSASAGIISTSGGVSALRSFHTGTAWHVYRLEAKADDLRVLIDGVVWEEVRPSTVHVYAPSGQITGLWAQAAQVNVRNFRVFVL
jgi:hypothetical protein